MKGHFGWFSPSLVILRESRSKSAVSQLVAKLSLTPSMQQYFARPSTTADNRGGIMAAHRPVQGAVPETGYNASNSNRRTKRQFNHNIQKKNYFVPPLGRKVTLNVSARGIKVIDARGIDSVISELVAKGVKL